MTRRNVVVSLSVALTLATAYSSGVYAGGPSESGTIDFDSVPAGFTLRDDGGMAAVADVRTADSVIDLKMTREDSVERYSLPLANDYVGNENNFKARFRFAVRESGGGTDIEAGFFASDEANMGDSGGDSAVQAVIEGLDSGNYLARWFGGAGGYDRLSLDIAADTWYVYEFEFQPVPETAIVNLYEGDGTTLVGTISGGNSSGIGHLDQIGFGNLDCCTNDDTMHAVIDWMTYSVNEALPGDPANASDRAITGIPEPATALLGLGAILGLALKRRRMG
ncbi:hypothetical protein OAS39_02065 [Pirellulales bacterium]|nr:hypothetical protein [Pirellulales bacterium]